MALIELKEVTAGYGKNMILKRFNLNVQKGELVSLLGPSGCGKTTVLRLISGFLKQREGEFLVDGEEYTDIPVNRRNIGYVFQNYALFPHLTVAENVAFGLKMRRVPKREREERVKKILKVVNLESLADKYPKELSGGQKQRVAIARPLVVDPKLLLFDEPLSNLDAKLKERVREEIRRIQKKMGITTVYVTHDQEECFAISDKVAVMNGGVIEQLGTPEQIFKNPKTEFVAKFVGIENFIDLTFKQEEGDKLVYCDEYGKLFKILKREGYSGTLKRAAVRPDDIVIERGGTTLTENSFDGEITFRTYLGKYYQYTVTAKEGTFYVNEDLENVYEIGTKVSLKIDFDKIILVE